MIIPFFIPHAGCPHQCVFCDQNTITGQTDLPGPSTLVQKVTSYLEKAPDAHHTQIAFYGGSFTALPPDVQRAWLETARPFVESGRIEGIRLSTRPDAIDDARLSLLKTRHVRTVELGAQSLDDEVLRLSGRGHTSQDTRDAVGLLRQRGFLVGLQLMAGLPGDTRERFRLTVRQVASLRPDFVRLYPALVIKDTPLEKLYRLGKYAPLSLDEAVAWCRDAYEAWTASGIAVIRMGLQPTAVLEKKGTIITGPYHPAFRQLVESSLFLDRMRSALSACDGKGAKAVFSVNPRDVSTAAGQRRSNIIVLRREFGLQELLIRGDVTVAANGMPGLRMD